LDEPNENALFEPFIASSVLRGAAGAATGLSSSSKINSKPNRRTMKKSIIGKIVLGIAFATALGALQAEAQVAVTNGSFETTGTLYNGALGGLYEAPPWVNLCSLTIQSCSAPNSNPPNGEIGAFGPSPFPTNGFVGSRYLRLNADGAPNNGATALTLGTMQAGHVYTVTANLIGVCSVSPGTFNATLALVSNPSLTPTTTYSTVTYS
jgi:hypothetical protein